MEMTQVQRLTKVFQELDRVTPRPLDHEDYAICADQFFRDGQIDHIKDTQGILKSGIESVEAKLQDEKKINALREMYESSVNTNVAHTRTIERLETGLEEAVALLRKVYEDVNTDAINISFEGGVLSEKIKDYLGV